MSNSITCEWCGAVVEGTDPDTFADTFLAHVRSVHSDFPYPDQAVRNGFTDATGRFFGGIWRSSVGTWRVRYTENELCVLTSGRVRIRDTAGGSWTFGPGDCFVIPSGVEGVWEVLEPARKFYAIYEPGSG